jgi:hypothetical protein
LDNGLTWKKQLDKVTNKAYSPFWACTGMFGRTWGLRPKVLRWIYTIVVRPTITYAATVWLPRVKFNRSRAELNKLQRLACLGITRAMRMAPTAAIEVFLRLPSLHLQLEAEVKAGIYRLCCGKQQKPKSYEYRHAYMSPGIKVEPILQIGTDKMIPRHIYNKIFSQIP